MKKFLYISVFILIMLAINSCNEDKAVNVVPKVPDTTIFKIATGNIWEYRNNKNEKLTFEIAEKVDTNWVLKFYLINPIQIKNTYICKMKKFIQGFPELTYYSIAETDSGIYFGTNSHFLVSDNTNLPYFFNYVFLKKNLNDYGYTIKADRIEELDGKKDFLVDSLVVNYKQEFKFADSTYKEFDIQYFSNRYPNLKKSKLQNFSFAYGFGFTRFFDYNFVSFQESTK